MIVKYNKEKLGVVTGISIFDRSVVVRLASGELIYYTKFLKEEKDNKCNNKLT